MIMNSPTAAKVIDACRSAIFVAEDQNRSTNWENALTCT